MWPASASPARETSRRRHHHQSRAPGRPSAAFFATLTAAGLTGLLAALAMVLLACGCAAMRRATV